MRKIYLLLALSVLTLPALWLTAREEPALAAQRETKLSETAWHFLVRQNPDLADDESISLFRRLVLNVLTPHQAEDLYNGADPAEIILDNGLSLEEFMQRMMSSQRGGLTYVPIVPCTILDTGGGPSGEMNGDEIRTFGISREQRLLQGGNEECGLPRGGEANIRAWAIDVRATASRGSGLVKVWQGEHPEPTEGVAGYDFGGSGAERFANFSVVPACGPLAEGGCWESDFNVRLKGSGERGRCRSRARLFHPGR